MSSVVVDSSVLLAVLGGEADAERFLDGIDEIIVSTVNLTEVASKLILAGLSDEDAWRDAMRAIDRVVEFDQEQSRVASGLILRTNQYGLSLGDRACIALGLVLQLPIYTADRAWRHIKVGVPIRVVR